HFLFSVRYLQKTILAQFTDITRMQEAIGIEHFAGSLLVIKIRSEYTRAFYQYLSVCCYPCLEVGKHPAYRPKAYFIVSQTVYCNHRGSFSKSVTFQYRYFSSPEHPGQSLLQGSPAGNQCHHIAAQSFPPFLEYELSGKAQLCIIQEAISRWLLIP